MTSVDAKLQKIRNRAGRAHPRIQQDPRERGTSFLWDSAAEPEGTLEELEAFAEAAFTSIWDAGRRRSFPWK